jgi:hypothetical protein
MPAKFFIFGDSHSGRLLRAARGLGLDFAGGSVMAGEHFHTRFFTVTDGRFEMLAELGKERLGKRLSDAGLSNLMDVDVPFLSTVGFNTTNFSNAFEREGFAFAPAPVPGKTMISHACFDAVVKSARAGAIAFYRALHDAGKRVYAVPSPQRFPENQLQICRAFEAVMMREISALGVTIVDVRAQTTDARGILRPEYAYEQDHVHANDAFGEIVLGKFGEMLDAQKRCLP